MANDGRSEDGEGPGAEEIIDALGGIRPAAAKLAVPVTTVQGWKVRRRIPENRREAVEAALMELGLEISWPPTATEPKTETQFSREHSKPALDQPSSSGLEGSADTSVVQPLNDFDKEQVAPARFVKWLAVFSMLLSFATAVCIAILLFRPGLGGKTSNVNAGGNNGSFKKLSSDIERRQLETSQSLLTAEKDQEKVGSDLRALETKVVELSKEIEGTSFGEDHPAERRLEKLIGEVNVLRKQAADIREEFQNLLSQESDSRIEFQRLLEKTSKNAVARMEEFEKSQAAFRSQIKTLRKGPADRFDRHFALLVSVGQLEWMVRSGRKFDIALQRVRYFADSRADLIKIIDSIGSPSNRRRVSDVALADGFDKIRSKLAGGKPPLGGWNAAEGAWAQVKSLIGLRRLGPQSGSLVTKIERALVLRDFQTILDVTEGFGDDVNVWRQSVERRLRLESLLVRLNQIILGVQREDNTSSTVSSHPRLEK